MTPDDIFYFAGLAGLSVLVAADFASVALDLVASDLGFAGAVFEVSLAAAFGGASLRTIPQGSLLFDSGIVLSDRL